MKRRETLTKENFSDYPKACKLFCDWIDEYKKDVQWGRLFNENFSHSNIRKAGNGEIVSIEFSPPKFHEIPYEMQQGIWICFATETLGKHFEQPEYTYSGDLEEDIKTVFSELENIIE